jgi:hypothetical protein
MGTVVHVTATSFQGNPTPAEAETLCTRCKVYTKFNNCKTFLSIVITLG